MTFKIRRMLVAVADGSAKKVADRAAAIAKASAARMELFSVVRPVPPVLGMTRIDDPQITAAWIEVRRQELERLAKRLRGDGVAVTCNVAADLSVTDAIVRRARESKADLVAIQAHKHNVLARLLLSQNDYDLIRECPMPLLIVKGAPHRARSPVLAALDPWHSRGKPKDLDDRIVQVGRGLAHILGAALHSAHVYSPLVGFIADSSFAPVSIPISGAKEKQYTANVRRHFRSANAGYKISSRHAHLHLGDPALAIPAMARTLKAQLLVMGAVSRSAVRRLLLGNTAERILDELPCDVLVVKPRNFSSSIK
jgi:universal stress protein E